ncbi:hypothetical protein RBSH_04248 [Rhodopirellula baltica SH28]|uniref:Uncharacterized protein n=1 Tax=Rhodopirellula baltica SH28 TaxID=993517 RepID=K5E402_RHOBT|nr:hypothetical protein RBSH_04248 [Rhodopirellula baltica SH28]
MAFGHGGMECGGVGGMSIGGAIAYRWLPSEIPTGMETCVNAWPRQAKKNAGPLEGGLAFGSVSLPD